MSLEHVLSTCHVSSEQGYFHGDIKPHLLNDSKVLFPGSLRAVSLHVMCPLFLCFPFIFYCTQSFFLFQMLHLSP